LRFVHVQSAAEYLWKKGEFKELKPGEKTAGPAQPRCDSTAVAGVGLQFSLDGGQFRARFVGEAIEPVNSPVRRHEVLRFIYSWD
jgi:hypothetical protein